MSEVTSIPEFDPMKDVPDHFLMIIYGIRRSGKTFMLKHMLESMYERLQFHETYVICSTLDVNPDQYSFLPKTAQFSDVANIDYHLRKIYDNQKRNMQKRKEAGGKDKHDMEKLYDDQTEDGGGVLHRQTKDLVTLSRAAAMNEIYKPEEYQDDSGYHPVLLILDDVVSENAVRSSPYLKNVAIAGRHLHISCIILSQAVAGSASVPPAVRIQADLVLCVAQPRSRNERDLLAEQFLTSENRDNAKTEALKMMDKVTEVQHRAIVMSTVCPNARSYIDYLFMYGPVPNPPTSADFKLGTEEQWSHCDKKPCTGKGKSLPNPFGGKPDLPKNQKTGEYFIRMKKDDLYW
jgi:hypothetical protein